MENISTWIICIILAGICVYALISYRKKLKGGCCGGGDNEVKVKPKIKDKSHYLHKAVIYIDGMTCEHCKIHIENAFNRKDGCFAKVNLRKKCAEVWSDNVLTENEIRQAVEDGGYTYVRHINEK